MNELYYHTSINRSRLVHVVDSDVSVCESLSVLLRLEGFQTEIFFDVNSFLRSIEIRRPDTIIIAAKIGNQSSLSAVSRLKEMRNPAPIFMLSDEPNIADAVAAMKLGVTDFIEKPVDSEKLLRSIRESLMRSVHIGAMQGGRRPIEVRGFNQLTPREREVLQLITNGQSNKEAGRELGISPRTIEVHRARIMEKLGAKNTADLVRIVLTS